MNFNYYLIFFIINQKNFFSWYFLLIFCYLFCLYLLIYDKILNFINFQINFKFSIIHLNYLSLFHIKLSFFIINFQIKYIFIFLILIHHLFNLNIPFISLLPAFIINLTFILLTFSHIFTITIHKHLINFIIFNLLKIHLICLIYCMIISLKPILLPQNHSYLSHLYHNYY